MSATGSDMNSEAVISYEHGKFPVIVEQLKSHGLTSLSKTQDITLEMSRKILETELEF